MGYKKKDQSVEQTDTVGKTETFFTRHVKLLAFLLTLTLFLAAFTPLAILEARDYFSKKGDNRPEMTTTDLILLMDRKSTLTLDDFTAYVGREMEAGEGDYRYYYIEVSGGYLLTVAANRASGRVEMCLLRADGREDTLDLMSDLVNVRAYFAGQPYRTMSTADVLELAGKKKHLLLSDLFCFREIIADESNSLYNEYRIEVAARYLLTFRTAKTGGVIEEWWMERTNGSDRIDVLHDNVDLNRYFAGSAYWNMTASDLIALFDRGNLVRDDLMRYAGASTSEGYRINFDRNYYVLVNSDAETGLVTSCVLADTNVANGKYKVDLMISKVDLRDFLAGNAYQTMSRSDLIEVMTDKSNLKLLDFVRFVGNQDGWTYQISFEDRFELTVYAEEETGRIESCLLTDTKAPGEAPVELMGKFDLSAYFAAKP